MMNLTLGSVLEDIIKESNESDSPDEADEEDNPSSIYMKAPISIYHSHIKHRKKEQKVVSSIHELP